MVSLEILRYAQAPSLAMPCPDSHTQQPFTENFPQAEIYELLSPDLLHQLIKGTFKDHLVHWVITYFEKIHTAREAKRIKDIIDRRCVFPCSLIPPIARFLFHSTVYPSHPLFQDCATSRMEGISANGQETTRKP